MRRLLLILGLLLALGVLVRPHVAAAGLLTDQFGVVPALGSSFTNRYDGAVHYRFDYLSLIPSRNTGTVDYVIGDWIGEWSKTNFNYSTISGQYPSGGEPYDVEAYYFNDDPQNLYIAIITSFDPNPGHREPRVSGSPMVVTGDLALDLSLNGAYSFIDPFNYDYGVDINDERRWTGSPKVAESTSTETGNQVYRTSNADWYTGALDHATAAKGEATNFDPKFAGFGGAPLGTATVEHYELVFPGGLLENGYKTYVIEATIPRSVFPDGLEQGTVIGLSWVEGCRNDGNNTQGILRSTVDVDTESPAPGPSGDAPEPSGLLVWSALIGTVAMVWSRRRRRISADLDASDSGDRRFRRAES